MADIQKTVGRAHSGSGKAETAGLQPTATAMTGTVDKATPAERAAIQKAVKKKMIISSGGAVYIKLVGNDPVRAVRQGLPVSAVDEIIQSGAISSGEVYGLVLPRKTLSNRKATGTLTPDQSDKLVRVARVIAKAEETFGDPEKAYCWLRRPTAPLNDEEPLKLLDTEAGARKVEELLIQIDHGIAA